MNIRLMMIGASAAGKTTLIQRLSDEKIKYDKTQAVEYVGNFIDTPGEYMQQRGYWGSLTVTSNDAEIIALVHDSTSEDCWFSGGTAFKFEKPVVGIITKIDSKDSNPKQSKAYLELAGCKNIFEVSSYTGEGVPELIEGLNNILSQFKKDLNERINSDRYD